MKDHWKQIKKQILENVNGIFESSTNPRYTNIEQGIELFRRVLLHKTGNKNFDGLSDPILEALNEVYNTKPGSLSPCRTIVTNIEAFLKKLIFIIDGEDVSTDRSKNLAYCLKRLQLLKRNGAGHCANLDLSCLSGYKNNPDFLEHVCRTYIERNDIHNAPQKTRAEVYQILDSALVVYIYAVLFHFNTINSLVGTIVTDQAHNDNYKRYTQSVLSYNMSVKMLEADFGVRIQSLDEFDVSIKAKARRRKEERDEYLKEASQYTIIPFKFLPEIEGVISSNKFILLHGIATSGKTTILKKLGRDFLDKYNSPYLFYFELSEIFKKKNGHSIVEVMKSLYKEVTSLNLDLEKINDKVLLLLDGLDEVPLKESRDKIIQQVIDLKKFNNIQVVITSRTNDYITNDQTIESYFEKFELLPIGLNDIMKIGEKILGHDPQYENFVRMVKKSTLLKAFPKTPLTSILLAIVFKETNINIRELPKNISELYKKFVDLFLNRWDKTKGISEQFEIQKKEFVLQTIAVHMQKNRMTSITEVDLVTFVEELASRKHIGGPRDAKAHLQNLCDRTSILVKDEINRTYRFFHLTIQEYLSAQKFDHKDDDLLVQNFYDEWWLNPNIFYAGSKTEYPEVLSRVADFEIYPADAENKFNYIAHSSQVLLAAHNVDNEVRLKVLRSMVKIFDEFTKELIQAYVEIPSDPENTNPQLKKLRDQTLLDVILSVRDIFMEFFQMEDFKEEMEKVWESLVYSKTKINICDITLYSISYCLAILTKDAKYLEDFVLTECIVINKRWFKIVDVDITVKKLNNTRKKIKLKIRNTAQKNNEYIQKQFKERLKRHYSSLIGLSQS